MKKYSNYAKKSVSLILAVLMVLSCWVWVAPTDVSAEEIEIEDTTIGEGETVTPCPEDEHEFAVVEDDERNIEATCTEDGVNIEKCSVCGTEKETVVPAGHNYEETEDGHMTCVCGDNVYAFITFDSTADGIITAGDKEYTDIHVAKVNKNEEYTVKVPATVKTDAYSYSVLGWFKGDNKITGSTELKVVAGNDDETYTAEYSAIKNKYTITYVNEGKVVASYTYEYGDVISHTQPAVPVKPFDEDIDGYHYTFVKWVMSGVAPENNKVVGNVVYTADYVAIGHTYEPVWSDPTCSVPGGLRHKCVCGFSYITIDGELEEIPHTVGEILTYIEPTIYEKGYMEYICFACGEKTEEDIPALEKTTIKLQVYDENGNVARFATVEISYKKMVNNKEVEVQFVDTFNYLTDANGFIVIEVPADYKGWVARIYYNGGSHYGAVKAGEEVNIFGVEPAEPDFPEEIETPDSIEGKMELHKKDCSCACHRKGLWGFAYRLLQKFVFRFTGRVTCCSLPDNRISPELYEVVEEVEK